MRKLNIEPTKKIATFEDYQSTFLPKHSETEDMSKYSAEESGIKMAERSILHIRELIEKKQ